MERYETEEQQIEAIKQFWKDNGTAIIIGVVLGVGGLWSWRWYSNSQLEQKEMASVAYQQSVEKFVETEDYAPLQTFISENDASAYTDLAALIVAQQALEKDELSTAKEALSKVAKGDDAVADIAKIRLAKLHIQAEEYDQAVAQLAQVKATAFNDQVFELKGDALVAKGDFNGAEAAYSQALVELPGDINIQMKLDNIAYVRAQAEAAGSQEVSQDSE